MTGRTRHTLQVTTPRTTLLYGGHIFTPGAATAIMLTGATISWLGSDQAGHAIADPDANRINLTGALVTPLFRNPFADQHNPHPTATQIQRAAHTGLDLTPGTPPPTGTWTTPHPDLRTPHSWLIDTPEQWTELQRLFHAAEAEHGAPALAAAGHRILLGTEITTDDTTIANLARWAVLLAIQPSHHHQPLSALSRAGIPLALDSADPDGTFHPWAAVRAASTQPENRISPRAAFIGHTMGGYRFAGIPGGRLTVGAPADLAIWRGGTLITPPADTRLHQWSTDPYAQQPKLPDLSQEIPSCTDSYQAGRAQRTHD